MLGINKICVSDNESNEQEPAHRSLSKSNTPSRHNMKFVEVPKIDCDDIAYEF
jgi:hypothetical protein